ncbi:MAG: NUDIX hydrolase [Chloroflexota bacterium]
MSEPSVWQTKQSQTVFQNRWIRVEIDDVLLPNGNPYEYTRVNINGVGVGVIGFNSTGNQILLEREYRHGVGEVVWQCPGGLAQPGEDLQVTALRELREETGYAPTVISPENVRYLGKIWDSPPLGHSCNHIFAVWGLELTRQIDPDEAEFVTCHWRSVAWLKEAIRSGEVADRFVVSAVSYLLLNNLID